MSDIRTFHESLDSLDQDFFNLALSYIVEDGSEGRIKKIKDEIAVLKDKINIIMDDIEFYKSKLLTVKRVLDQFPTDQSKVSPSIQVTHSILSSYASALTNLIGELRPDDLLERKSLLTFQLDQLESRRSAAVAIQRMIS
jgi:hypothetical protein